jgi:hypothetical protein
MMQHSQIYNMIWSLFETNEICQEPESGQINMMLSELNEWQIKQLINEICEAIHNEPNDSINFALLLSFKKSCLDCIIQHWSLDQFQLLVPDLHPMECVYVILNSISISSNEELTFQWFDDDFVKAFSIFEYIVRWINWKVASNGDEAYYETYFATYGRQER